MPKDKAPNKAECEAYCRKKNKKMAVVYQLNDLRVVYCLATRHFEVYRIYKGAWYFEYIGSYESCMEKIQELYNYERRILDSWKGPYSWQKDFI